MAFAVLLIYFTRYFTFVRRVEADCNSVALLWRHANNNGEITQHQYAEPVRHSTVLAGAELDVGDEDRLQEAGHHQSQADGEEHVCRKHQSN